MKLAKLPTILAVAVAALLLLALAACGADATTTSVPTIAPTVAQAIEATSEATTKATTPATVLTATETPASAETPESEGPSGTPRLPAITLGEALASLAVEFEGEGAQETEQFIVAKGVMILMANHDGDGKFNVTITTKDQDSQAIIDEDGQYFGNFLFSVSRNNTEGLSSGGHTIKVDAEGPWRIRLFQDFPTIGKEPTIEFGGVGDGGGGWMSLQEGEYTIRASHDGDSHFQVRLHEARGATPPLVIDTDGAFDATVPILVSEDPAISNIAPGIYGIGVHADGIWSLIIEDPNNPDE
ncbi:MAG: hypothetical protein BZY75_00395 [SAR202 cluster bacterium Io17-Chloro-G7]|nr:MAG: hypothetical protein BZY75_00395 [SAR202 cluster bacterium Io17-Chloro-G7]